MTDDEINRKFNAVADLIQNLAAAGEERQQRSEERFDREMAKIQASIDALNVQFRRAVRFSVEEARRERLRRKEGDERLDRKIAELAAMQQETERQLQAFLNGMRRGGNGKQGKDLK